MALNSIFVSSDNKIMFSREDFVSLTCDESCTNDQYFRVILTTKYAVNEIKYSLYATGRPEKILSEVATFIKNG